MGSSKMAFEQITDHLFNIIVKYARPLLGDDIDISKKITRQREGYLDIFGIYKGEYEIALKVTATAPESTRYSPLYTLRYKVEALERLFKSPQSNDTYHLGFFCKYDQTSMTQDELDEKKRDFVIEMAQNALVDIQDSVNEAIFAIDKLIIGKENNRPFRGR